MEGERQWVDELADKDGGLSSLTWKDDNLFHGISLDYCVQLPLNRKKRRMYLFLN